MDQLITPMTNKTAVGGLFSNIAITSHQDPLIQSLKQLNYPEKSIKSMLKCGIYTGYGIFGQCSCKTRTIPSRRACNLRSCVSCAKKRKKRIRKRYMPVFNHFREVLQLKRGLHGSELMKYKLLFFTVSPKNYDNLEDGIKHVRASFAKFIRRDWVKNRVAGGCFVIEAKNKNKFGQSKGWNVHIHGILISKKLDICLRGYCPKCKQNYIKYDKFSGKYHCANRKCGFDNPKVIKDSKVVREWLDSSDNRPANILINNLKSSSYTLNYMLKYISSNKDDFDSVDSQAVYIKTTQRQKLINTFGVLWTKKGELKIFEKFKFPSCKCVNCGDPVFWFIDYLVWFKLFYSDVPPPSYTIYDF